MNEPEFVAWMKRSGIQGTSRISPVAPSGLRSLNRSYLSRWAKALGVESLYREARK